MHETGDKSTDCSDQSTLQYLFGVAPIPLRACFYPTPMGLTSNISRATSVTMAAKRKIDVPKLVKRIRKRHGLTQEGLANKLGVGFTTVNRWERGHSKPIPSLMARLMELDR